MSGTRVGYLLRRMIAAGAPESWTPLMRLVAFEIADDAHDPLKDSLPPPDSWPSPWSAMPIEGEFRRGKWHDGLAEVCGMSARAVSRTLADLAAAGFDMRQPIAGRDGQPVRDKRGRLVYAAKGHAVRFVVPFLPPRRLPDLACNDAQASIVGDGESLPDSASIPAQRSPVLASKVAGSGEPIPPTSPAVKVFPHGGAPRLPEDQDQTPSQDPGGLPPDPRDQPKTGAGRAADPKTQLLAAGAEGDGNSNHSDAAPVQTGSVAKSQNPRLPNGSDETADQAQQWPNRIPGRATITVTTRASAPQTRKPAA